MKLTLILSSAAIAASCPYTAALSDPAELASRLMHTGSYAGSARYEVLLQQLPDPVAYSVSLESRATNNDSLSACDYIISWKLPTPSGQSEGFSAYFDGHHFRFRDTRMQEYHYEWEPEPFAPSGHPERGVQNQAQFAELLPQNLGKHIRDMLADSTYVFNFHPDTVFAGQAAVVIDGIRRSDGYDWAEYVYVFDGQTYMPLRIELENNPGQIGEQSIIVDYKTEPHHAECVFSIEELAGWQPDAFGRYRESTFSLATLPGQPLPRITCPTTTGERYHHERGEGFAAPTIIVFLDAAEGSTAKVIDEVRSAVDILPRQTDVIWAFLNNRTEDIDPVLTHPRPGEHILQSAHGAARDCGIGAVTPVLIFAGTRGIVTDYILGYNKDLPQIVIQKASVAGMTGHTP